MPSFTKLAVSTLALLAYSADAAPVLAERGTGNLLGNSATVAGAKTDLKVFADAFLQVTTGGKTTNCDNVNLGLVGALTANVKATTFSTLAVKQCVASYSDVLGCTEFGAYLAASYYAYISGWTGATLFAALEPVRVDRWHSLFNGFCGAPGAPAGVCGGWANEWNNFAHLSASVSADIKASAIANLQTSGLLLLCDTTAVLKAGVDGVIRIGATAKAQVDATVSAVAKTDIKADVKADVDVRAAIDLATSVLVKAKADAEVAASVVIRAEAELQAALAAKAKAVIAAGLNLSADVLVKANALVDTCTAALVKARAQVTACAQAVASADLKLKAALSLQASAGAQGAAVVHRDLLDIVGGLQGEGKGHGFLGVTGDKLDLGLAGAGQGKGFLGAVVA